MELLDFIKSIKGHKLISRHKTKILSRFIPLGKDYKQEFTNWVSIGCWYEKNVRGLYQNRSFHRSMDRIESILSAPINQTSTITMLCLLPRLGKAISHPIEAIMPIIRHNNLTLNEHRYLTWKDYIIDVFVLSKQKPRNQADKLLMKYKAMELLSNYQVDKEKDTMTGGMLFKVVGINKEQKCRKIVNQLAEKYPELQYANGKSPRIALERKDFIAENGYRDTEAVAVQLISAGNKYQIGWLSSHEENHDGLKVVDNNYVTRMLNYDDGKAPDNQIINEVSLHSLGSFTPEGKTDVMYFAKVMIKVNVKNMG